MCYLPILFVISLAGILPGLLALGFNQIFWLVLFLDIIKNKMHLIFIQIYLFSIATFGFFEFISADRTITREFFSDFIEYIFNTIHPFAWLFFTSLSITVVSIATINTENLKRLVKIGGVFCFLIFQLLIAVYLLSMTPFAEGRLTYWYITFLVLIVWDFLYQAIVGIAKDSYDLQYNNRIVFSGIYHLFLFLLVLNYEPILGYFTQLYKG